MKGMSWIIIAVLLAGLGLGGFYFYQQTTELRSDLLALRQKLDRIEAFVKSEEDIRKMMERAGVEVSRVMQVDAKFFYSHPPVVERVQGLLGKAKNGCGQVDRDPSKGTKDS